jgi:hydroxymethylbilane synthase
MADFILATRGSKLARVQAHLVREGLERARPQLAVREEIVRTTGDRRPEEELTVLGGSGVFTKELENALLEGRADAAVHSLKDLPVELPSGLVLGAILRRAHPGDVLVGVHAGGANGLPSGARIGTGSPRRAGMMRALREDVAVVPIRGNVPTRVERVAEGKFDAVILAAAGLQRLGLPTDGALQCGGRTLHVSPLPGFLPAPGQGAIAVEVRADDTRAREIVAVLDDTDTSAAVRAERAVLRALGGGCHLALGALGRIEEGLLHLEAVLFDATSARPKMAALRGPRDEAEALGRAVAAKLRT